MTWKKVSIRTIEETNRDYRELAEHEKSQHGPNGTVGEVCDCNDGWTRCPGGANCDFPNPEQDPDHRHLCEKCNGTTIVGRPAPTGK